RVRCPCYRDCVCAFLHCISTTTHWSWLFFFSSRRRHTRSKRDWSSDVCSSDLGFMHEGRIDVIGAGAVIWAQLLDHIRTATNNTVTTAITSEKDILDGIALSLLR